MSVRMAVVMDPIAGIDVRKDTSFAMLLAGAARGWFLYVINQADLFLLQGEAWARSARVEVRDDRKDWYTLTEQEDRPLSDFDIVLMRKDPPVDAAYITATQILDRAQNAGVLVANRPQTLRDCNEKLFATEFPDLCPPLVVSARVDHLKKFHAEHGNVIFKPLDGMGGRSIFHVHPDGHNLNVILETLTQHGQQLIMAQRYLPEITEGDKRILIVDGKPVPFCLARLPGAGEHRGNLAAGGRGEGRPLTKRDREIAEQIAPVLVERGVLFAGLDVIGDFLTEINITSPTCVRELDHQFGLDIAGDLLDRLAERI